MSTDLMQLAVLVWLHGKFAGAFVLPRVYPSLDDACAAARSEFIKTVQPKPGVRFRVECRPATTRSV